MVGRTPALSFSKAALELTMEKVFEYFDRAAALAEKGMEVISFGIGQPDFPTPEHICEAAKNAIDAGFTTYVSPPGIRELREAIAEHVSEFTGAGDVKPEEVIVLPGCKAAIFLAIASYVEPGDEVIVPDPGFPTYECVVRYAGGRPVFLPLREELDFRMTPEAVQDAITEKTKMVIVNSPHNPTGGMCTKTDIQGILEVAKEHGILVVSDEIYDHYVYDGEFTSVLVDPEWRDFVLYLNGFSKTYSMTGWRLGYIVANAKAIERLTIFAVNNFSCTASFVQKAGVAAIKGPQDFFKRVLDEYKRRREAAYRAFKSIPGVKVRKSPGAFYIFPNIKEILKQTGLTTEQFAIKMLELKGVVTPPGVPSFPLKAGEGYLRVSYALPVEKIERGAERFREGVEELLEKAF